MVDSADFFKAAKNYELTLLTEYTAADRMLYGNIQLPKLQKHEEDAGALVARNPYWLLYDLIKNEERDGRAFIELLRSIEYYGDQAREYQSKIESNLKGINDSSEGRTSIRTLTMKGTNDQIKYQLEVETEVLKREQVYTQTLRDIVTALVAFIEIEQYRQSKRRFYQNVLDRLVQNQASFVGGMTLIWTELQEGIAAMAAVFNE